MWLGISVAQVALDRDRDVVRYECAQVALDRDRGVVRYECGLGGSRPWRRQT